MPLLPTIDLSHRAKLVLSLSVGLGIAVMIFVYIEIQQNREELLESARAEAGTIAAVITHSASHTLATSSAIEELIDGRLAATAAMITQMEAHHSVSPVLLRNILEDHELDAIVVLDATGREQRTSTRQGQPLSFFPDELTTEATPVLTGEYLWLPTELRDTQGRAYNAVIHARQNHRGAILVALSAADVDAMRKQLGVGRLLQNIGDNPDIAFLAIQDSVDILAGTRDVHQLESFETDTILATLAGTQRTISRIRQTPHHPVLEVIQGFQLEDGSSAIVRIGLRLDRVRAIQQSAMIRTILLGTGILLFTVVLTIFLLTRRRFSTLQTRHRRMSGYTDKILDGMSEAVVAVSRDGGILTVNKAAMQLLPELSEWQAVPRYQDLLPDDPLRINATLNSCIPVDFEDVYYRSRSGQHLALGVSTSLLTDEQQVPDIAIAIARDVTTQRSNEEQIQRETRLAAMGALAGEVAHEIRNPINAVSLIAQRLQREFSPPDDSREYQIMLQTMRTEIQRVNQIVTQFLQSTKPPRTLRQSVDAVDLVKEVVMLTSGLAEKYHATIGVDCPTTLVAMLDRDKMKQVLLNVFQNGLESLSSGGTLTSRLYSEKDSLIFLVQDTGIGMSEEIRAKMFDLHFTTKPGGTGLGLSIVHQIVTEHGGEITVESNPGSGTTVMIRIPQGTDSITPRTFSI